MVDFFARLRGMSPGTLRLIKKEVKGNPIFQERLRQLLEQPDPKKAVFQDMLEAIRTYVSGEELPDWKWWELIDEVERFSDKTSYFPTPGDEGALLHRVLAALSIEAAVENKADKNLPWKTFAPSTATGISGGWMQSRQQKRKKHHHKRQRRLAVMTPEDRAVWLGNYKKRKIHRKHKGLSSKFSKGYDKYGGIVGTVIGTIGAVVALFAPIGTVIGAVMIVAGTAMTLVQQQNLARQAAAAQSREMMKVQDDYESGVITEAQHGEAMTAIIVAEGEKLAAKGQLPPDTPIPETVIVSKTPEETKKIIADIVIKGNLPDKIIVPEATSLVNNENQYIIEQSSKLTDDEAGQVGLVPAKKIAQVQKTTKKVVGGAAAIMAAAASVPFIIS